jgi:outer membrane protein assembly factor BamA
MGPEVKLFHRDLFNLGIKAELPVSVTYKVYELAAFRLEFPLSGADNERVGFELTGRYASRPSENFFGIGNDSVDSARAEFRGVTREGGGGVVTRISDAWSLRVGALYRSVGITHPRKFRSASDVFQGESLPGLTVEPAASFLVSTVLLQHDTRDNPDLPGKGGLQRVEVRLNEGQTGGDFSYWQYRGQLQQFFPFSSDGRTVIGIRGSIETNQPKGGSSVPVFDLPFIGSYSTLRGFQNRRFVDRSAVTGTVEYRYRIWRHFDWGFFVDQGQVAPEVRDFAWDRLHTGYGMRFVVRAGKRRAFVVDMARSREEPFKLYLDFSPLF